MLNKANAGTATIDGGESAIDLPCDDPANGRLPRRLFLEDPADLNSVLTSSLARLSGAADLREFLAHVMGEILRTTGAGNVAITRYDPISNQLHLELLHDGTEARWGPCGAELAIWAAPYDADITPAFRFGLQHPGVFVASMHADQCPIPIERFALPGGLEWATSIGVSDMAVSLLMAGENPVGTFHLHFTGGRILRRDDLPLLEALVQQAAIALRIVGMGEQAKESAIALERERAALAQQVQAKRINDFLSQTMVNLSNEADLSTVIESILVTFAKYLEAVHVFLFRFDPTRNTIRLDFSYVDGRSRWGMSGEEMALWAKPFSADVTPAWRIMCEQQGLFTPSMIPIAPEEFGWPGAFDYIARYHLSDVGHIVLFTGDTPVGSIGFGLRDGRQLQPRDKAFIEAVAQQAAVAVRLVDLADEARQAAIAAERARAALEREKIAREQAEELAKANTVITESLRHILHESDPSKVAGIVLLEIARQAGAQTCYWFQYDALASTLCVTLRVSDGVLLDKPDSDEPALFLAPFPTEITGAFRALLTSDDLILMNTEATSPLLWPGTTEWHRRHGRTEAVAYLVRLGDQPFGLLGMGFTDRTTLTDSQKQLVRALSNHLALAVRLVDLADQAREVAVAREQEIAAQHRATELAKSNQALQRTVDLLSSVDELDEFIPSALQIIQQTFGSEDCAFWENENGFVRLRYWLMNGRVLRPHELPRLDGELQRTLQRLVEGFTVPREHLGIDPSAMSKPVTLSHLDGTAVPEFNRFALAHGWELELNVPLLAESRPVGNLTIYRKQAAPFTETEIALAETLGKQLALALGASRLADSARRRAVELAITREREKAAQQRAAELAKANEALRRSSQLLAVDPDIDRFVRSVLVEAMHQANARDGILMTYRDGYLFTSQLVLEGENSLAPAAITEGVRSDITPAWNRMVEKRAPLMWDVERDADMFWPGTAAFHLSRGTRRVVTAPMFVSDKPLGYFGLALRGDAVGDYALELIQALADQAALALQFSQAANADKVAAIARERELAAEEKAAELAHANEVITGGLRQLSGESDLSRVPGTILMEICEQAEAVVCCWLDFDPEANTLRLSLRGRGKTLLVGPGANEPGIFASAFSTSVTSGFEYLLTKDDLVEFSAPENEGMAWPGVLEWHRENGRDTMLAYAVKVGDRPIGVVGMGLTGPVQLSRSQRELIRALANHLALAVHLSRLSGEASQAATLNERNRIAREIHDSLAQCFTGILMQLQAAGRMAGRSPEVVEACVGRAESLARSGLKQARRSVMSLIQDDEHYQDLGAALRSLVDTATADTGTAASVEIAGTSRVLHPLIAVNVLRICQEALGNAQRYAHARMIAVRLAFEPNALHLCVADDGTGFVLADHERAGFGLQGMRERADRIGATLLILTAPGAGTKIQLDVPNVDRTAGRP